MNIDLRHAGLSRADERRVRLAANALAAHHLSVSANAWNGARSDVLVIDSRELAGAHALLRARELAIPTLDLRERAEDSAGVASVVWLTRSLYRILRARTRAEADESPGSAVTAASGLVQLATDPALAGKPVHARLRGLGVWLLPQAGRIVSMTVSDQLNARARLGLPDWQFEALPVDRNWRPDAEISASLDAFYMEAAWHAREQLPRFPAGRYRLTDWPDLGTASSLVDVLRIVRVLLRERTSVEDAARESGLPERDVSACLWALHASGLLSMQLMSTPRPAAPRRSNGLWSRLAVHFGLARAV